MYSTWFKNLVGRLQLIGSQKKFEFIEDVLKRKKTYEVIIYSSFEYGMNVKN